ncbi:Ubiquitin carboxyl-terminal hydrolase 32 [Nymphon striatum]|nr:Ubiquitin carboxyl-terminal hydrolase 32 [Nymphon striatum]
MGTKLSRQCPITYEEAVKRVNDSELARLRDAFKRAATQSGTITKQTFVKEVLGDTFPVKLAEHIYQACGGSIRGLTFKELVCGLVLLTSSSREEKIRFIFLLYANEAGTHVLKNQMVRLVKEIEGGYVPEAVADCFLERESVCFEDFAFWLLTHEDATCLTRWLLQEGCVVTLSNNLDTPTFYQTLAGVTHLEENDIIELEKRYWILKSYSCSGKFDVETLKPLVCPPLPISLVQGLFNAFDENRDNHIDFKEMACGISACCRGPLTERQKFCFKVFDQDQDGFLNKLELETTISALLHLQKESQASDGMEAEDYSQNDIDNIVSDILLIYDNDKDDKITMEEYLVWTVNNHLPLEFTNLLFQICHIVLGLKPSTRQEEAEIIRGWIKREDKRGIKVGQYWYLINIDWWRKWNEYVDFIPTYMTNSDSPSYGKLQPKKLGPSNLGNDLLTESSQSNSTNMQSLSADIRSSESDLSSNLTSRTNSTQSLQQTSQTSLFPVRTSLSSLLQISTDSFRSSKSTSSSPNHSPRPSNASSLYPHRPPAIDNSSLIVHMITAEGGRLKRNVILTRSRDFELVPEAVWRAMSQWYGGSPPLPRQVIQPTNGDHPELELYPITLQLYRHQTSNSAGTTNHHLPQPSTPKRYLAYVAAFSRLASLGQISEYLCGRLRLSPEDMRLWLYKDDNNMTLLEDDIATLELLRICDLRNKDQTWPEEMSSLMSYRMRYDKNRLGHIERGLTGLNNLGNTCFMNAAVQCVSNTAPLTMYFNANKHLYELNRQNPLGMKGHIAKRYGDLVQDLWSATMKTIAPLKLRWTIGKCAPRFNGFQQHDCQELLAFLLDGLHEDLNRVHVKPYTELKDSNGRPDVIVAQEAWENHILRNKSIIVDLFHGQLKSKVTCKVCGHTSVRFDPFNYLSLPLPMESCIHIEVIVIKLDGSIPIKYGLRLGQDCKYISVKEDLSKLCYIPKQQFLLAEICNASIKCLPSDDHRIRPTSGRILYAYEVTTPVEFIYEEDKTGNKREKYSLTEIQRSKRKKTQLSSGIINTQGDCDSESVDIKNQSNGISDHKNVQSGSSTLQDYKNCNGHINLPMPSTPNHIQSSIENNGPSSLCNGFPSVMTSSMVSSSSHSDTIDPEKLKVVTAYHRKMIRQDVYFLSSQKTKPSLFGLPIIIPITDTTTNQNIYELVWTQVSRLVSPLPPTEGITVPNHAQDCDDSLGYEYPFVLKAVESDGLVCSWCPWFRFCRGCRIECNNLEFLFGASHIAIDWDPTALHLRYQTAQEKLFIDHESVEKACKLQTEPIDLNRCLEAFTKEEELGENEKYYCSKCETHQVAQKKLQMWRLPPILIVHLKRFQFVNQNWVKSHKIVSFPSEKFCPTPFLASVPKNAVLNALSNPDSSYYQPNSVINAESSVPISAGCKKCNNNDIVKVEKSEKEKETILLPDCSCASQKAENIKLFRSGFEDRFGSVGSCDGITDSPQDFHQHRLKEGVNPFILNYNLYAISCHTGILGGGHYVCFAKNQNKKWYCYNDSSCKEVKEDSIDSDSAYILFYEREGIDYTQYLPNVDTNIVPDISDIEEELDTDFKKVCVIL